MTRLLYMSLYKTTGKENSYNSNRLLTTGNRPGNCLLTTGNRPGSLHKFLSILVITTKDNYHSHAADEKAEATKDSKASSGSQS